MFEYLLNRNTVKHGIKIWNQIVMGRHKREKMRKIAYVKKINGTLQPLDLYCPPTSGSKIPRVVKCLFFYVNNYYGCGLKGPKL